MTKKQDETLTLRQDRHESCKFRSFILVSRVSVHHERRSARLRLACITPLLLAGRVDHRTPDPRLKRPLAAKVATGPDERGKGVLHGFASPLAAAARGSANERELSGRRSRERRAAGS